MIMPTYSLDFEIQINVSPQTVYDHLRDPHNLVGLQPLLTHVENVQASHTSVSYDTVEAFRWLGIVLYRNRIHVQTTFIDPPQRFETVVHSFPNITLQVGYTFTPQGDRTLVCEEVRITCHAWLAGFVTEQATRAQTALLENLKTRLEAG